MIQFFTSPKAIALYNGYAYKACIYGYPSLMDEVNFFIESMCYIDEKGMPVSKICQTKDTENPLIQAIIRNDFSAFKQLLDSGEDPNQELRNGLGPLHLAIQFHRHAIIEELLTAGADIDAVTSTGETFLIKCIKNRETETALYLIQAGANVNISDNDGKYAMDYAFAQNQLQIARTLLDLDAKYATDPGIIQYFLYLQK